MGRAIDVGCCSSRIREMRTRLRVLSLRTFAFGLMPFAWLLLPYKNNVPSEVLLQGYIRPASKHNCGSNVCVYIEDALLPSWLK